MARYIDADKLIAEYDRVHVGAPGGARKLMVEAPTADVAPVKHGEWSFRSDGAYNRTRCYCSACGKHSGIGGIRKNQLKPYCPNCGAKMKGGAE